MLESNQRHFGTSAKTSPSLLRTLSSLICALLKKSKILSCAKSTIYFAVSDRGKLPYQIPHFLSVQFNVCWQERITTTHTLRPGVEPSYSRYSPVALPIMLSQVLLQKSQVHVAVSVCHSANWCPHSLIPCDNIVT